MAQGVFTCDACQWKVWSWLDSTYLGVISQTTTGDFFAEMWVGPYKGKYYKTRDSAKKYILKRAEEWRTQQHD